MNAPKLSNSSLSTYGSCVLLLLFLLLTSHERQAQSDAPQSPAARSTAAIPQPTLDLSSLN